MADYSTAPTKQGSSELIPHGTLAKGWLVVEPYNKDQGVIETPPKPGGKAKNSYLKCSVSITEGEHERRKVFHNIMRGDGTTETEKARNMGNAQMRAILEYGQNAGPNNPAGYRIPDDYGPLWKEGIPVGIKIGVEKGKDGYQDKNVVLSFLSPNPESDSHKDYQRLVRGDTAPSGGAKPTAAAAQSSWTTQLASNAAPAAAAPQTSTGSAPAGGGWGAAPGTGQPQPAADEAPAHTGAPKKPAWIGT